MTARAGVLAAATCAAVLTLTACGESSEAPEDSTATSSGQTNQSDEKQAAVKASQKTIRTALSRPALSPYPETLYSDALVEEMDEAIAQAKKEGQTAKGRDKVVSMDTMSTSWDRKDGAVGGSQVATRVCVERNARWLDKDGKDMRGNQDRERIKPGSRAEFLVRTVPGDGEQEGRWIIDSMKEQGSCSDDGG